MIFGTTLLYIIFNIKINKECLIKAISNLFFILPLLVGVANFSHAEEIYGTQTSKVVIQGEQPAHPIPDGWQAGYFKGDVNGEYVVEYTPNGEDVRGWKNGYLAISRYNYPENKVITQIKESNLAVADVAVMVAQEQAQKGCAGTYTPMSHRNNIFNDLFFSVSGGFCNKYGVIAPLGEGAIVSTIEGKDYLFNIQYSWRPQTKAQQNLDWGTTPSMIEDYLTRITQTSLCGSNQQPKCN